MKILIIVSIFTALILIVGIAIKGLKFIHDLIDSLTTEKGGFSARKIVAYAGLSVAGLITVKHTDASNADTLVMTWLGFVLLSLGLVTISQLNQLKSGSTTTTTDSTSTVITKTDANEQK